MEILNKNIIEPKESIDILCKKISNDSNKNNENDKNNLKNKIKSIKTNIQYLNSEHDELKLKYDKVLRSNIESKKLNERIIHDSKGLGDLQLNSLFNKIKSINIEKIKLERLYNNTCNEHLKQENK